MTCAADAERIAGMSALTDGVGDALPTPVEGVAGELDDAERAHHLHRVWERPGFTGLRASEAVHRDDLDLVRKAGSRAWSQLQNTCSEVRRPIPAIGQTHIVSTGVMSMMTVT